MCLQLLFVANTFSQYRYTYDSISVFIKQNKKSPFKETKIAKKGIIELKENYIKIDDVYYHYCLTLSNEKIAGRYVDSCCQTCTDYMLNVKTSEYFNMFTKYKNYKLVYLCLLRPYAKINYLNIKQND